MPYSRGISALAPRPLLRPFLAAAWLQVAMLAALATATEPQFAPQTGLLLLRNGNVLQGEITQAGDYYVVILGKSGELRLAASEVEAQVATLDEAYELKRHGLFGRGATPHLELAEWCLRQGLLARCGEQLELARQVETDNPRIADLERRLKLATAPPPQTRSVPVTVSVSAATAISSQALEKTVHALPRGSVEKFAAVVQPLLLNRCGANQCHGTNAKTALHLVRPPAGQAATQRITQRNLYAVLQQLNPSDPEKSPLLVEAQRRHGTALTAPFDRHTQKQLDELTMWVLLTVPSSPPGPPTIAVDGQATLLQPALPAESADSSAAAQDAAPATAAGKRDAAADRFVPRDPFDAELFNRRFGKKK
jgi:hypothetical protein